MSIDPPAAWTRAQIALADSQQIDGRDVLLVFGWMGIRYCGCQWRVGERLDTHEPIFATVACVVHQSAVLATRELMLYMPPNGREIGELFQDVFETTIKGALN